MWQSKSIKIFNLCFNGKFIDDAVGLRSKLGYWFDQVDPIRKFVYLPGYIEF